MADPQVNPNALGAPTEGFGQTVTFAFDPRGVTPALDIAKSTPAGGGAGPVSHGALRNPDDIPQPRSDGTAELLMKAGAEIIAPLVERSRNEQFVKGVQAAMGGEAAADIAKQQPWYSRIFGDTPAVAGARAYEVQNKVNNVVSEQLANMDKLQKMGPEDASKHFSGLINGQMTGDPQSDSLIAKSMIDQLPGLMKAQAKAYHGYTQRRAVGAMSQQMASAGDALQQAGQLYSQDTIDDKDFAVRKQAYIHSIMPPDGINEENYAKTLAANIRAAADKGQFHVIAAIKESGGFDAMTPEQQNQANLAIDKAAVKYRDRYAFDFARQIAELKSDQAHLPEGMTPHDIADRYTKMNTAFQKLTGSPVQLFTSDEMAGGIAGSMNYLKAEEAQAERSNATLADKNAKAEAKQLAAQELDMQVQKHIAGGTVFLAKVLTKATNDQIDAAAYTAFTDQKNPQVGTDLLRKNFVDGGYTNPILKQEFMGFMRRSEGRESPSMDFLRGVARYNELASGTGGKALADSYFGDYAPRIERFNRMTGGDPNSPNVADAFTAAMDRSGAYTPQPMSAKDRTKLAAEVASMENSNWPRWLGGKVNLRGADTVDALATVAQKYVEDWRGVGGVPDAEAVKRGIAAAITNGNVEVLGGFAIRRGDAPSGKSLRELSNYSPEGKFVAVPAGREDAYFSDFLSAKLKADGESGLGGASVIIHNAPQVGGVNQFSVTVTKDGVTKMHRFTAVEYQRYVGEAVKHDTVKGDRVDWPSGVPLNVGDKIEPYMERAGIAAVQAEQNRKLRIKP